MITVIQACKEKDCRYQLDIAGFNGVVEVLTPEGNNPSRLRNLAAKKARGEVLLFLDDDSGISQDTIDHYINVFKDERVQVAGGPAVIRNGNRFAAVLGSYLALGASCARYKAVGLRRKTSEQELILCNLAMRKDFFLSGGGFAEKIYPWEENNFLIHAEKENAHMIYDPELITSRGMTSQLSIFLKKIFSYGKNRGRFNGLNRPEYYAALLFVPFLALMSYSILRLILFLYFLVLLSESIVSEKKLRIVISKVFYTFLTHVSYSCGLWWGLGSRLFVKKRFRHLLYSGH